MAQPFQNAALFAALKALAVQVEVLTTRIESLEAQQACRQQHLVEMLEHIRDSQEEVKIASEEKISALIDCIEKLILSGHGCECD